MGIRRGDLLREDRKEADRTEGGCLIICMFSSSHGLYPDGICTTFFWRPRAGEIDRVDGVEGGGWTLTPP
jgi:hypothetical protein